MLKLLTTVTCSGRSAGRFLIARTQIPATRVAARALASAALRTHTDQIVVCPLAPGHVRSERLFHTTRALFNEVHTIKCPQLSESLSEGDIRLVKSPGDEVAVDDVIAEVETDKTSIPIHSPVAGVIESFCVEDGSTVKPGSDIAKIKVGATGSGGGAPAAAPGK